LGVDFLSKSNLEKAVTKQAGDLPDAQRELVLSQFATYMWNKKRMAEIEAKLQAMDLHPPKDPKEFELHLKHHKMLTAERNQLTTSNNSIASKLFMQLRDTGEVTDEFDEFFKD